MQGKRKFLRAQWCGSGEKIEFLRAEWCGCKGRKIFYERNGLALGEGEGGGGGTSLPCPPLPQGLNLQVQGVKTSILGITVGFDGF